MTNELENIIAESQELPFVSMEKTVAYKKFLPEMIKFVNNKLTEEPSISQLTGNNPLQEVYDTNTNHSLFMTTVFSIGNYELLARTIPWFYRSYHAHNFSYEYFIFVHKTWIKAIEKYITTIDTGSIISIYKWMIEKHQQIINISKTGPETQYTLDEKYLEIKNSFKTALLKGNIRKCLHMVKEYLKTPYDLESLYLNIIQPAMYDIGILWEMGKISVAQEHLASAIVGKILASVNMAGIEPVTYRGKVIVTCAPNEFHEIGAWMLSDIFDHDGWDVQYLGANTPQKDLICQMLSFKPDLLAISATMPCSVLSAKNIILAVRNDRYIKDTKILVGGYVFNNNKELWKIIGADAAAGNLAEAKLIAKMLLKEKNDKASESVL